MDKAASHWLAHYRRRHDGFWLLYVGEEIRAVVADPVKDAKKRFPGKRLHRYGAVNVEVEG